MTDTVNMPMIVENFSVEDLLKAMTERLDNLADVLDREHKWLDPKVKYSREIEDDSIKYELEHGHINEAEAAEKRAEDNLILTRKNVDMHLENIRLGAMYVKDVSDMIRAAFIAEKQDAANDR